MSGHGSRDGFLSQDPDAGDKTADRTVDSEVTVPTPPVGSGCPLRSTIARAHAQLSPSVVATLVRNLQVLAAYGDNSFGTLSSGTDIISIVIRELVGFWFDQYGIDLQVRQAFACESHKDKLAFLDQYVEAGACLFADNTHMSGMAACCKRHQQPECVIPHVRIGFAGFSCQSRSALNNSRSLNAGCVQQGTGKTGESWMHVREFIAAHHPDAFLSENVPALSHAVPDAGDTDSAFIVKELKAMGYGTVIEVVTQATDYGSITSRKRLYWLAVLSSKPQLADVMVAVLAQAKIPELYSPVAADFLLDADLRELATAPPGTDMLGGDLKYKTEHMDLFDQAGLTWPAPRTGDMALQQCMHLDQRAYETVFFCHHAFPYKPNDEGTLHYEFVDGFRVRCNDGVLQLYFVVHV